MNIAVFGGSFDPFHNGHGAILESLTLQHYDKIIILPCGLSPFKSSVGNALDRLTMINNALIELGNNNINIGVSNIEISTIEIYKRGTTYIADSIEGLKLQYSGADFSLIVGMDIVYDFHKWHKWEWILTQVKLVVYSRQGVSYDRVKRVIQKNHIKCQEIIINIPNTSSTQIKLDIAFKKDTSLLHALPQSTIDYINDKGLYLDYVDIVGSYNKYGLSSNRVEHIYRVGAMAIDIAKNTNANLKKVILAVLCHDIAKRTSIDSVAHLFNKAQLDCNVLDDSKKKQHIKKEQHTEHTVQLSSEYKKIKKMHANIQHAYVGAVIANKVFNITDKDILNAIRYHTTGRPRMSIVEKVVFLADMVEYGRDGVDAIRQCALCGDINGALKHAFRFIIDNLTTRQLAIDEKTRKAYDYYVGLKQ